MHSEDLVAEFVSFREVLDRLATNLSEDGVFLDGAPPGNVGTEVAFKVRIRDGFTVLAGQGQIVKAAEDGVYLRLSYLDQPSLRILPKLLDHYRRQGVPLLELPEVEEDVVEEEEVIEDLAESSLAPVEIEDELPRPGETMAAEAIGREDHEDDTSVPKLTLADVEAEFKKYGLDGGDQGAVEEPPPVGDALLVDAADLVPRTLDAEPAPAPPEIHFDDLVDDGVGDFDPAALAEGVLEDRSSAVLLDVAERPDEGGLDAGLPWLPDEDEKKDRKDLWVILVWVLLGAAVGAAFYFLVLRPGRETSSSPAPSEAVQAQAMPVALVPSKPTRIKSEVESAPSSEPLAGEPESEPVPTVVDPLTGVERITWERVDDETVVTLWADGSFVVAQVDDFRVDLGSPREVVRIRGIRRPFAQQRIELDTAHVRQIRTGLHQDVDGSALHVVADLVDSDVELLRTEAAGQQLRVYFSKTG